LSWRVAGASGANDRESAGIGALLVPANAASASEQIWLLDTAKIQEMVSGAFVNNGFLLQPDTELDDLHYYYSSDYTSNPARRPKLVIQYSLPQASAPQRDLSIQLVSYHFAPLQQSGSLTFTPIDDAYIASGSATTNYGTATTLQVDNSPIKHFLLKFDVTGVNGQTITNAKLRLYNMDGSSKGGDFYRVNDNSWQEETVTWNNAPTADTTLLASLGTVSANTWYEVDITSLITSDGTYSLRVSSISTNGADYSSKEGANPPQLVITLGGTPTPTVTPTSTSTPTVTATATATNTPNATDTFTPTVTATATPIPSGPVTINYVYDSLHRLTEANYSNGDTYHYTYDAVGNRKTQTAFIGGITSTTTYNYDHANRLTDVNGVTYTYDNNGNLLNDGVNAYTYDSANRLKTFNGTSSYSYNGLGDRISQTVNSQTTNYTLDLNTGLTQVLNDGTNAYVYGLGRIAQVNTTTEYFLGDALGSVRQLTNTSGQVTLAKSYNPYGEMLSSNGSGASPFAYTGEQQDASGLTYLRSRYYASGTGRFLTRDTWEGDENSPLSFNRWNYVQSNPINYIDPTGQRAWCPWWWNDWAVKWRVDVAEEYVSQTSDPMDTYTAAGIAIQCAGSNWNKDWNNSGSSIAQISLNQANTESGQEITDIWGNFRGYGLRQPCPDGSLEKPLDPNNTKDAVILMKREIQLVTNACKGCTTTDIYIAAALAQNGPGFRYTEVPVLGPPLSSAKQDQYLIKKNWFRRFADDVNKNDGVNTRTQLNRFTLVVKERLWCMKSMKSLTKGA